MYKPSKGELIMILTYTHDRIVKGIVGWVEDVAYNAAGELVEEVWLSTRIAKSGGEDWKTSDAYLEMASVDRMINILPLSGNWSSLSMVPREIA